MVPNSKTRSPFRPNPIGLTCVKLERIELTENGPIIHVLGADLRDGTPIFDIKPYIPFADCHPDAQGGFIDETPWQELTVHCPAKLLQAIPEEKREGLLKCWVRTHVAQAASMNPSVRIILPMQGSMLPLPLMIQIFTFKGSHPPSPKALPNPKQKGECEASHSPNFLAIR